MLPTIIFQISHIQIWPVITDTTALWKSFHLTESSQTDCFRSKECKIIINIRLKSFVYWFIWDGSALRRCVLVPQGSLTLTFKPSTTQNLVRWYCQWPEENSQWLHSLVHVSNTVNRWIVLQILPTFSRNSCNITVQVASILRKNSHFIMSKDKLASSKFNILWIGKRFSFCLDHLQYREHKHQFCRLCVQRWGCFLTLIFRTHTLKCAQ